jgi:hypothetical protein
MHLIDTSSLRLREFVGEAPPYGILSHTWEADEVLFPDLPNNNSGSISGSFRSRQRDIRKKDYRKIQSVCEMARGKDLNCVWIDTCRI